MMETQVFTLPELVDIALCTPVVGVVNFNILRIVLHTIIKELNLKDLCPQVSVEDVLSVASKTSLDENDSKIEQKIEELSKSGGKIPSIIEEKIDNVSKIEEKISSTIGEEENLSKTGSALEPKDSAAIEGDDEAGQAKQVVSDLKKELHSIGAESSKERKNTVTQMWRTMNLTRRVDALEGAMDKFANIVDGQIKNTKEALKEFEKKFEEEVKEEEQEDEEKEEKPDLKKKENRKFEKVTLQVAHIQGQCEFMAIKLGVTLERFRYIPPEDSDDSNESLAPAESSIIDSPKEADGLIQEVNELSINMEAIHAIVDNFSKKRAPVADDPPHGSIVEYDPSMHASDESVLHMLDDLAEQMQKIEYKIANLESGEKEESDFVIDEIVIQETIEKVQELNQESEKQRAILLDLMSYRYFSQGMIEECRENVEFLKKGKIEREEFYNSMNRKADREDLSLKIDQFEFNNAFEEFNDRLGDVSTRMITCEMNLIDNYDELTKFIQMKANFSQYEELRDSTKNNFRKMLLKLVKIREIVDSGPLRAGGVRSKCICCSRSSIVEGNLGITPHLERRQKPTREVFEKPAQLILPTFLNCAHQNRYQGGRHTLTYPKQMRMTLPCLVEEGQSYVEQGIPLEGRSAQYYHGASVIEEKKSNQGSKTDVIGDDNGDLDDPSEGTETSSQKKKVSISIPDDAEMIEVKPSNVSSVQEIKVDAIKSSKSSIFQSKNKQSRLKEVMNPTARWRKKLGSNSQLPSIPSTQFAFKIPNINDRQQGNENDASDSMKIKRRTTAPQTKLPSKPARNNMKN